MGQLPNNQLRRYGLLALPMAVAGLPLYIHAPDFYVTHQGVGLGAIGIVLLLARIIDAIQDPLIGALSDRYAASRRQIIVISTLLLGVGMFALFVPPPSAGIAWFAVSVVLSTSCYSVVAINLNAVGGIWSDDSYERTRIASSRERFGLIGVSIGVVVPGVLAAVTTKSLAYGIFAGLLALLLIIIVFVFNKWAHSMPQIFRPESVDETRRWYPALPSDKRIRRLVLITFVGALASSLPAVLFLFFVRDRLGSDEYSWVFLLIYFAAALAGVPVWRELSGRYGKVISWCISILVAIGSFIGASFTGSGDIVLYVIVCLATGFALGGDLVFPASIMADLIGNSARGKAQAGYDYAWLSFVQKAGLGLAAGLAFPALGMIGFTSGESNSAGALFGLVVLYAMFPLLLKLIGVILLWNWRSHFTVDLSYEKESNANRNRPACAGSDSNWMQKSYEN